MVRFGSKVVYPADPEDIWGNVNSIGNAELAARLGSINTFERRGNTVWIDDFESTSLKWTTGGSGTYRSHVLSAAYSRNGNCSMKLTAGEGIGGTVYIQKYAPLQKLGKIGLEGSFTLDSDTKEFAIAFLVHTGTRLYRAMCRYSFADKTFDYEDSPDSWVNILSDIRLTTSVITFNTMKMVIDTAKGEYLRLLCNTHSMDLSGIPIYSVEDTDTSPRCLIYFRHASDHDDVKSIYLDDVIFTQNE